MKYPCSRGALLHYLFEEDQPNFNNATFYTTQSETFDRTVHTDVAAPRKKRRIGKGKRRVPPSKRKQARPYKWNLKELIVEDRLLPLMDIVDHERTHVTKIPMQFDIDARMPARLHFDVYSTTQPHMHIAHGPLRDADGHVFESLTQYPSLSWTSQSCQSALNLNLSTTAKAIRSMWCADSSRCARVIIH